MVGTLTLAAFFLGRFVLGLPGQEAAAANTMAFATLTFSQLVHAFNVRSERESLWRLGLFSNRALKRAFFASMLPQLAVLCLPLLQRVFSVCPMTGTQWLAVLALSLLPLPICEGEKWWRRQTER